VDRGHEEALLKIYGRLRPGNPPQVDKAKQLFEEKFFDENRYRLGKVGRFRINRKFDMDVPEDGDAHPGRGLPQRRAVHPRLLRHPRRRRAGRRHRPPGQPPPADAGRTGVEEMRKGFLKLRRTVQERMSVKDPDELSKIADLINSKSISSAIDFFFGRSELSQVVDQTNPLSMLVHERGSPPSAPAA
jgi:DNA-directed RNA polymerase subunit beta